MTTIHITRLISCCSSNSDAAARNYGMVEAMTDNTVITDSTTYTIHDKLQHTGQFIQTEGCKVVLITCIENVCMCACVYMQTQYEVIAASVQPKMIYGEPLMDLSLTTALNY